MNEHTDAAKSGRMRPVRWALIGLVVLAQVVVVGRVVLDAAPEIWESRWVQDDAYISFRFARNFVDGHGLVFNPGERVEGYTNFLWTMIAAVPLKMGDDDPLAAMHRVAWVLWYGSYGLLLGFGGLLAYRGVLTAPLMALPLVAHWSFNQWYLSGMETPLVCFLSLLAVVLFAFQEPSRRFAAVVFGTACVLLLMTRPDTVVFIFGLAVALLICDRRWLADRLFWRRWVPSFLLPATVLYLPYTLWRLWFYGDLLPNTYYAKAAYSSSFGRGFHYLLTSLEVYAIAPFLVLLVVAVVIARDHVVRRFLAGCVYGSAGVLFYVVRLGGDFMEWRFLMPITGVLLAGTGVALYVVGHDSIRWIAHIRLRSQRPRWWVSLPAVIIGVVCAVAGVRSLHRTVDAGREIAVHRVIPGQETIPSLAKYAEPSYAWREIGLTCKRLFPPGTRIATGAAGMIPYFAELPTLDLHGLTDRRIAREPIDPAIPRRMGHEHHLTDRRVMRERGVDVYLRWPRLWNLPRSLAMDERQDEANASIRLRDGRYFEVIFLNPDGELVRRLDGADDVEFRDLTKVTPNDRMIALAPILDSYRLIDRIDVQNPDSEAAHQFDEIFDPDAPWGHNHHDKVLAYFAGGVTTVMRDDGRRIFHQAVWMVDDVSTESDLLVVLRHDHTVSARYTLEVNGQQTPQDVDFQGQPEQWGEIGVIIPRHLLVEGENSFRLTREREIPAVAEIFHIWVLQKIDGPGPAG